MWCVSVGCWVEKLGRLVLETALPVFEILVV